LFVARAPEKRTGHAVKVYQNAAGAWHAIVAIQKPKAQIDVLCDFEPRVGQTLCVVRVAHLWIAK
jgi:hypothetical protein